MRLEVKELPTRIPFNVQTLTAISKSGACAVAIVVIMIVLGYAMLRRSRRQNCLYHSKELGEIVPSLPYRKQNANAGTASVDSFESDVSV